MRHAALDISRKVLLAAFGYRTSSGAGQHAAAPLGQSQADLPATTASSLLSHAHEVLGLSAN